MIAPTDLSKTTVRLRQGETLRVGTSSQEVSCDDIARLALAIHAKGYFFSHRRGLSVDFCRDLNGSGVQRLEIGRKGEPETCFPIRVFFEPIIGNHDNPLYEADLITDQRKDYEPTVNRGKHRFFATGVELQLDLGSKEVQQWRRDIERLAVSPDTLADWVEAGLDMLVRCRGGFFCNRSTVLTRSNLARHVSTNVSLEELRARLKCSRCGEREPQLLVFVEGD